MACWAQEYKLEEANVWFVRFCLDPLCTTLACGNRNGTLLLWDPNELRTQPRARLKRPASATRMAVSCPPLQSKDWTILISFHIFFVFCPDNLHEWHYKHRSFESRHLQAMQVPKRLLD